MLEKTYPQEFYARSTVDVAQDLLGAVLCRRLPTGQIVSGPVIEVEAYTKDDPASHAFRGITPRSAIMFGEPGIAYVYFIYGMYHCLNVVTEPDGTAGAVLIRAIGAEGANGPGKLCRQWSIDARQNGANMMQAESGLWICEGAKVKAREIGISARIGIKAGQDRLWRFFLKDHPGVSAHRKSEVIGDDSKRKTARTRSRSR